MAARTIQRVYQITFEAEKPKLENGKKRNRPGTDNGYPVCLPASITPSSIVLPSLPGQFWRSGT